MAKNGRYDAIASKLQRHRLLHRRGTDYCKNERETRWEAQPISYPMPNIIGASDWPVSSTAATHLIGQIPLIQSGDEAGVDLGELYILFEPIDQKADKLVRVVLHPAFVVVPSEPALG